MSLVQPLKAVARVMLVGVLGVALLGSPRPASSQQGWATETQQIIHVLNRIGYGPSPGDIGAVGEMGVEAYIEQQLDPASIPDPVAKELLADFRTFQMNLDQLRESFQPVAEQGARQRLSAVEKRDLANRMGSGTDREPRIGAGGTGTTLADAPFRRRAREDRPPDYEIITARTLRGVFSERQLLELMVDFWMNHFSMELNDHYYATHYEEQVVRPLAFGTFEELLFATAKHPAMLEYLDNWLSAAPAEVLEKRLGAIRSSGTLEDQWNLERRRWYFEQSSGLNENYGRELMELHTLGVEGGYTQDDVIQVARAFTGWTITGSRPDDGVFTFDPLLHDEGDKLVLGVTIKSGGIAEGEEVLRLLAHHPSTARFISAKLARRFIADDPPPRLVEEAAQTFLNTRGDIREVLRTIFRSPEFLTPEYEGAKLKKPLELVLSSLRAVDAEIHADLLNGLNQAMGRMGEQLYGRETPDGWPDVAAEWLSTNSLLQRMRFAFRVASGEFRGITPNLDRAQALMRQMGLPEPTLEQIEVSQRLAAAAARAEDEMMASDEAMMAEATVEDEKTAAVEDTSAMAGEAAEKDEEPKYTAQQVIVATMLGSPNFQKR